MASLSDEELKQRLLRLLEEDEEFRPAVAGLVGLREILEELRWLRRKSLEHDKRFEAIEEKLSEHDGKLDEINKRLSNVEMSPGALTESLYARMIWEDLREEIRETGEKILHRQRNARLDGENIDLLLVTDRAVYVVEAKLKPKIGDVGALLAKAELAAKHYPDKRRIAPVLAGAMIGAEVAAYAARKGGTRLHVLNHDHAGAAPSLSWFIATQPR
ncbi:hypothetical protein [Pyrodictium abyssi]|uniref:DUF3782 domain-containing protein n=1 Tax=Pyrodictium abyssi TaxID=54256 RepID=A0ABM8IW97_9CREN|nr:hypothetical protein PABY_14030 [Pyrodictium abyssi]